MECENKQLIIEEIYKQAENARNKEEYTIEKVFKEIAQKEHTDVYALSSEVLDVLCSKCIYDYDYAKVVNEINRLIITIQNSNSKKLEDSVWYKKFKIEKKHKSILLVPIII